MSDAVTQSAVAPAPAAVDDDDDDDDDDVALLRQSRLLVRLTGSVTMPLTYSALSDATPHGNGGGRWRLITVTFYHSV